MNTLRSYYLSRTLLAALLGLALYLSGSPLWAALLAALATAAWFVYAPHSGRYTVDPSRRVTPLGRDERGQIINDKAARNAFVVLALLIAGLTFYAGLAGATSVPAQWLSWALLIAVAAYGISDAALRRR